MSTLRFTAEHEWLRVDDDGSISVGITDYAQEQLGDIVYVELPAPDAELAANAQLAVVESVKAVGEINMPFAGTVLAVNERLAEEPELVNSDPTGAGWLLRISATDPHAIESLMDEAAYQAYVAGL